MKVFDAAAARNLDRRSIEEALIPGAVLMDRAGSVAAVHILEFIKTLHPVHQKRFVCLAGKGNNGGDAYVVASRLSAARPDMKVEIWSACPLSELKGDAAYHAAQVPGTLEVSFKKTLSKNDFLPGDIIIDGLLGTGLNGPVKEPYDVWIDAVNASGMPVVSLDIASGINSDDGSANGTAIHADMTVTMGVPKRGLVLGKGREYSGPLRFADIGIPKQYMNEEAFSDFEIVFEEDVRPFFTRLAPDSHKNSLGRVLVVGGSEKYHGAPFLSASAALKSGAGLVIAAVPKNIADYSHNYLSLISIGLPVSNTSGCLCGKSLPELEKHSENSDCIVCGPGLGTENLSLEIIEFFQTCQCPVIFDADALNLIAANPSILKAGGRRILTPHPGEMQRLMKGFELEKLAASSRIDQAKALAEKTGSVVVLKGNKTVTASPDGRVCVNSSGNPALATAGSGDVLAGICGAFCASGADDIMLPVIAAVFVHGSTAEYAGYGIRGLTADELIPAIPNAMRRISPFA